MTGSRRLATLTIVPWALLLAALAGACGSDDDSAEPAETVESDDGTTTGDTSDDEDTDTGRSTSDPVDTSAAGFSLTTADGSITVTGAAAECESTDETSVDATFSDATNTVVLSVTAGTGTVSVPGMFEGRVDEISVGDTGDVTASGVGSLADDSVEPTTFEVTGSCT